MVNNEKKKISIIGGGISALVYGIYALKEGHDVTIYEKNDYLGGSFVSLKEKNKYYDNYIFLPYAYKEEDPNLYKLYYDIGLDDLTVEDSEYFIKYKDLYLYKDINKLRAELIDIAPYDLKKIDKFIDDIKLASKMKLNYTKPLEHYNIFSETKLGFSMKANIKMNNKYNNISISEYANKFENEDIKVLLSNIIPSNYSMNVLFKLLGQYSMGLLKKVTNNCEEIIAKLKNRFIGLNGKICLNRKAEYLDIKRDLAIGIWFENKNYVYSDYVVCAIDPYYMYNTLLKNKYKDNKFYMRYLDYKAYPTELALSFVFKTNIKKDNLPYNSILKIDKTLFGTKETEYIKVNYKDGYITFNIYQGPDDYIYWKLYTKSESVYESQIKELCKKVEALLVEAYERIGINLKLSLIKFKGPIEYEKETFTYNGSIGPFIQTKEGKAIEHNGKITNLKNVVLCSKWQTSDISLLGEIINAKLMVQKL